MAGHPAGIGDTKVDIVVLKIKDIFRGDVGPDHVAAVDVNHAFWFSGRAGGIKDIQGMFCIKRLGCADRFLAFDPVVPIDIFWRG